MKLLDKIKNALFEEDSKEEEEEIAKKVDIEKTIEPKKTRELRVNRYDEEHEEKIEQEIKPPVMFDDDDFLVEEKKPIKEEKPKEEIKPQPTLYGIKKEEKKPIPKLYGGYEEKPKEKFTPSPIISPVYGVLEKNYTIEDNTTIEKEKTSIVIEKEQTKNNIDIDAIREKAFGIKEDLDEDFNSLYEIEAEEKPGIDKVTIGDAEEYFNDLGLEYNVDYKDATREKMTRIVKNKELSEIVEEEIKEDKKIDEEIKSKRGRKTKIVEPKITEEDDITPDEADIDEEAEEKNLYDLIDMMYDSKE